MLPRTPVADDAGAPPGMEAQGQGGPAPEDNGYRIVIEVTDKGFTVEKEPMDEGMDEAAPVGGTPGSPGGGSAAGAGGPAAESEAPAEEQGEGAQEFPAGVDGFGQALKAALTIYKQNPVGADDQAQFEAGYGGPNETPKAGGLVSA